MLTEIKQEKPFKVISNYNNGSQISHSFHSMSGAENFKEARMKISFIRSVVIVHQISGTYV